VQNIKGTQ